MLVKEEHLLLGPRSHRGYEMDYVLYFICVNRDFFTHFSGMVPGLGGKEDT